MGEIFKRKPPEAPLEWTGERLTTAVAGQVEIEHLHRYFLARHLCNGKDVLDVASGEGYGSALISQVASSVLGVELDGKAVDHATRNYNSKNLRYVQGDACELPIKDACIDVVVSFETIEHLQDQSAFLQEVRRVLRDDGLLIVSSPNRDVYSPSGAPANPYHVHELTVGELNDTLGKYFGHIKIFAQRPLIGSALVEDGLASEWMTFERRGDWHFEKSDGLPRSPYAIAVASQHEILTVPSSIYIHTDEVGRTLDVLNAYPSAMDEVARQCQRAEIAEAALARSSAAQCELEAAVTGLRNDLIASKASAEKEIAQIDAEYRAALVSISAMQLKLAAAESRINELSIAHESLSVSTREATERAFDLERELTVTNERSAKEASQFEKSFGSVLDRLSEAVAELAAANEHAEVLHARMREMSSTGQIGATAESKSSCLGQDYGQRNMIRFGLARMAQNTLSYRLRFEQAERTAEEWRGQYERAERTAEEWRAQYERADTRSKEAEQIAIEWQKLYNEAIQSLKSSAFKRLLRRRDPRSKTGSEQ